MDIYRELCRTRGPFLHRLKLPREKFTPPLFVFGISPSELSGDTYWGELRLATPAFTLIVRHSIHEILWAAEMARTDSQMTKQFDAEFYLTQWGKEKTGDKKRLEQKICETGCWLKAVPNRLNGTILSAE